MGGNLRFLCSSSISSPWQHSQSLNTSPHLRQHTMLSLDIWSHVRSIRSHVRSIHVHHTWQSAVTLWCAWMSLCNHSLYCSEECALKNCLSLLHPRFRHYVSAELRFTIFSGRLYWHPNSHGQSWFQDNKSLPFGKKGSGREHTRLENL